MRVLVGKKVRLLSFLKTFEEQLLLVSGFKEEVSFKKLVISENSICFAHDMFYPIFFYKYKN